MTETWVPIAEASTLEMVRHAAKRGLVRLLNQRVAVLVSWPSPFDRVLGSTCRLETRAGSRFRVHIRQVEAYRPIEEGT